MNTFDRVLFKEAYKAGYKKAKLNEAVEGGAADYRDFFKKLYDLGRVANNIVLKVEWYDKNDEYKGMFDAKFDPYDGSRLYVISKTGAKKKVVSGWDIVSIEPKGAFLIKLKNKSSFGLWVFEEADARELSSKLGLA